jgi:hypothetical protein
VPVLRQYAAQQSSSERITLISSGVVRSEMSGLGFRATHIFEPLFAPGALRQTPASAHVKKTTPSPATFQQTVDMIVRSASPKAEKPVYNCGQLRPIIRNKDGKRVDKVLSVEESVVKRVKKHNLCSWHYLRADCVVKSCSRNHQYARPLSMAEYDAQWLVARQGHCHQMRKGKDCNDDQCIYGHGVR